MPKGPKRASSRASARTSILGGFFSDGVGFDLIPVSVQVETPRAIFGLAYRFEPDPIVAR